MNKRPNIRFGPVPTGLGRPRPPEPSTIAASFAEGLKLHQAGRLADAERIYTRILATRPDHFDSLHLIGVIFYQRGNYAQAVRQIDSALKRNPNNAAALNNRGNALIQLKRFADALASYERAIAVQRDFADAHSNRGNAFKELKRFADALASYDRALKLRPDFAEAHSNRGDVLHKLQRFAEALASCDRALALRPDYAEAHSNRGNALQALKRLEEALASHDRALALRPDYAEAHSNRGNALRELNRFAEALASYDRALALRRDFAEAHCNRGSVLSDLKRYDEALASYDRALMLQQNLAEAYSNRGNALKELDRFDEALASFAGALELRPDFADAHYNEALCRLLFGDFARGWEKNEWRWETEQIRNAKRSFPQPLWLGSDEIAGKTILLHAEQGLGDTIQFCRYVPLVAARGAQVILGSAEPLRGLMSTLAGAAQIVAAGDPLPDFDLHCPLLSLPLAFATRLETIPSDDALSFRAARQDTRVARPPGQPRTAQSSVWYGRAIPRKSLPGANRIDRQRSLQFDQLAPVLQVRDCEFYSLQKGDDAVGNCASSALDQRSSTGPTTYTTFRTPPR